MALRVEVREPLPRLAERVASWVTLCGYELVTADADIVVVCVDGPHPGWAPLSSDEQDAAIIASAIRPSSLEGVSAAAFLQRPFDGDTLRVALAAAEQAVETASAAADGIAALTSEDLKAAAQNPVAAPARSMERVPALTPTDLQEAAVVRPSTMETVRQQPTGDHAALLDDLVAAATEVAEAVDVLASLDDENARVEAVLTILRSHLEPER